MVLAQALAKGRHVRRFLDLNLQAQQAAQVFQRGPQFGRQHVGRLMVTGDETPQLAADDHRHRQARPHAHVPQVLHVHGRSGAQHGASQRGGRIRLRIENGVERHGGGAGVGGQAQQVPGVERAGLRRNVGGGKAVAQEGVQPLAAGLSDHFAGGVGGKFVEHHPVKARQLADRLGRHFGQCPQVGGTFEREHRVAQRVRPGTVPGLRRLEFQNQQLADPVHRQRKAPGGGPVERRPVLQGVGAAGGQGRLQRGPLLGQQRGEGLSAQRRGFLPQKSGRVEADLQHLAAVPVGGEQGAVGLDAAGNMNRLALAVLGGDFRAAEVERWKKGQRVPAHAWATSGTWTASTSGRLRKALRKASKVRRAPATTSAASSAGTLASSTSPNERQRGPVWGP